MKYKERRTGRLSQNVGKELPLQPCVISQNSAHPIYFAAEALNQATNSSVLNPHKTRPLKGRFTHSMPCPCRAVNSHMPCRAPAMLRQCSVLCESPRGSQKYPNSWSNSLTDRLFCSVLLPLFTVVVRRTGMLLITIFVELGVVAGRSRT